MFQYIPMDGMTSGSACTSTLRNHSGHGSHGYQEIIFMETAENYKRHMKHSTWICQLVLKVSCVPAFISDHDR